MCCIELVYVGCMINYGFVQEHKHQASNILILNRMEYNLFSKCPDDHAVLQIRGCMLIIFMSFKQIMCSSFLFP